jgi:hypothetical protein
MAEEATWMRDLLIDKALTQALVVALPEELPIVESLELAAGLRALHLALMAVVLNQATEPRFLPSELVALAPFPGLEAVARAHLAQAELTQQAVERLGTTGAPVLRLPRLYRTAMDRPGLEGLGATLLGGFERWA